MLLDDDAGDALLLLVDRDDDIDPGPGHDEPGDADHFVDPDGNRPHSRRDDRRQPGPGLSRGDLDGGQRLVGQTIGAISPRLTTSSTLVNAPAT